MAENKYLRITIHDNDYTVLYRILGDTIYNLFYWCEKFPTEKDLPHIKEYIAHLWWSIANMKGYLCRHDGYFETPLKCFEDLDISIVDDIPEWCNGEEIFIPLTYTDVVLR